MNTTTPARRRARLFAGVLAGAALVVAAPLAASAHVHVTPEDSAAGASTRLAFSFSHGCEDSPTTALVFDLPEGIDGATPVLDGAWTITRVAGDDGIPTQLTYTAVTPVENGIAASVEMDVIFASSVSDSDVAFPILQECVTGETDWAEVVTDGQTADDLEAPAPVVAVGEVAATDGHGHAEAEADTDEHAEATDHAEAAPAADPTALWLSGGALVVALAALGVALFRRRA
ncbi:DUF1775 domain-containing protein [Microbacterium memoriense]|uniref:DUF1775 domain-containing protein n=1 Tax=Microbacterium memoriense TaxID=2978350 RepID=A0ABT2PBR6_9MICO|nr:DUF1775 domain-containing protein [Microbacterium memoriense]MCT9002015.1 DUF1775 domain-containing protein [Microbacterium memoriense]